MSKLIDKNEPLQFWRLNNRTGTNIYMLMMIFAPILTQMLQLMRPVQATKDLLGSKYISTESLKHSASTDINFDEKFRLEIFLIIFSK